MDGLPILDRRARARTQQVARGWNGKYLTGRYVLILQSTTDYRLQGDTWKASDDVKMRFVRVWVSFGDISCVHRTITSKIVSEFGQTPLRGSYVFHK